MTAKPDEHVLKYHLDVLSNYNASMYESLLQPWHIVSDNLKEIEFDDRVGRGFFARKEKIKYWIGEKVVPQLPIRIQATEELKCKEDIILHPISMSTFRIKPEHTLALRNLIDDFIPFEHTHPEHWTLMKLFTIAGHIGKTFICIASEPSFGKSSSFNVLHSITDKCPVFQPRSVPGVLAKITGTGNIVFDEAHESDKKTRNIMEQFTLNVAGGNTTYINGAMKTHNTKAKYDCQLQSITYLYNNVNCYSAPEKQYFEMIFSNNKAMDDRLLKMKLKGKLTQVFSRDFDIASAATLNREYYIKFAKELAYLQEYKATGDYVRKYESGMPKPQFTLKGRRKIVFDEITWVLDQYCNDQAEYNRYIQLIYTAISDYTDMVQPLVNMQQDVDTGEVEE